MSCIFMLIGLIVFLAALYLVFKYGFEGAMDVLGDLVEAVGDIFTKHEHH
jgi:hypothetical protein